MLKWIIVLVLIAASLFAPVFVTSDYILHILIMMAITIILTLGWVTVMRTGQISLGQAAFWAVGAYTSALLTTRAGVSFWLAVPLAGFVAMIIGLSIGYVVLRVKGLYFAFITFAFAEIVRLLAVNWPVLGGQAGIGHIPPPNPIALPFLGELRFESKAAYYYLALAMTVVTALMFYRLHNCRYGRTFLLIWHNEDLAESLGISSMRNKMLAFGSACLFAGIAGSFFASYMHFINPEFFTLTESVYHQVFGVVGGTGFAIAGPVAGVVLLMGATEVFGFARELQPLIYGVVLVIVIMFLPQGVVSLVSKRPAWLNGLTKAWYRRTRKAEATKAKE